MTENVLVIGKSGQLGLSVRKLIVQALDNSPNVIARYNFTFVGRQEINLLDEISISKYFADKYFRIIINCAAYTAVDEAELYPQLAEQVNHFAVKQLAEIARQQNSYFIHISTDYVFSGTGYKPYSEADLAQPINVYGASKLSGELAIREVGASATIIRTSWLYSEFGKNFLKTMLSLGSKKTSLNVVADQISAPTYAADLAHFIVELLAILPANFCRSDENSDTNNKIKLYHYSNEGICSWYDFATAIFSYSSVNCRVAPIQTKDYPTLAKRPHYSVLSKSKIRSEFGIRIPYWTHSVVSCLKQFAP